MPSRKLATPMRKKRPKIDIDEAMARQSLREQKRKDDDFIAEIHTFSLEEYTLHPGIDAYITRLLKISGFEPLVRRWHVERLPCVVARSSLTMLICPYCGAKVTLQSCRIDHVIPAKQYIRYHLYIDAREAMDEETDDATIDMVDKPVDKKVWEDKARQLRQNTTTLSHHQQKLFNKLALKAKLSTSTDLIPASPTDTVNIPSAAKFERRIKELFNDPRNLLLCCQKCNSDKSDNMDISAWLTLAKHEIQTHPDLVPLAKKLTIMSETLDAINAPEMPTFFRDFILHGFYHSVNNIALAEESRETTPADNPHTLPQQPSPHKFRKQVQQDLPEDEASFNERRRLASPASGEAYSRERFMKEFMESYLYQADIQVNAVWRPTMTRTEEELRGTQVKQDGVQTIVGRLCFYCLGIYENMAFELDHIDAALKRAGNKVDYNNPTNIIPVCKSCNASKGSLPLNEKLLDDLLTKRQKDRNNFGIEHVMLAENGQETNLEYAIRVRHKLLGQKFKT